MALQDKGGTGKADVIERFGESVRVVAQSGTGIGLYKESIYAELNDRIVRYSLPAGTLLQWLCRHRRITFRIAAERRPSDASLPHQQRRSDVCGCGYRDQLPVSRKIEHSNRRASTRVRNWRLAAASGAMTQIRRTKLFTS